MQFKHKTKKAFSKGFFLLQAFTLISMSVAAQKEVSVNGYIKDGNSGEVLIGATVYLEKMVGEESTIVSGGSTNEFGYYTLSTNTGNYTLKATYIGFEINSKTVNLKNDLKIDLELKESSELLEEVVVNSELDKIKSTEISVNKIESSTITKLPTILGEPDILRSIQLLPGVSSANEASSGFNVRGGSADQNLILLDEGVIYNASHLFGLYSVFNTDAINNIKLFKGGIPSLYGGRLSSVLDIQQKEGNTKDFGGKASIGLIASKAFINGPIKTKKDDAAKGSYMIAARRSYADVFTFLSSEFQDNKLFFYDLNLKSNYQLNEKNKLFLSAYLGRDRFQLPGLVGTYWGNASGTLRWTKIMSEKLFFQTSAIYSNYDYNLDNLRSGSELRWKSSISNFNVKPRLTWFINPENKVKFGADAIYYTFKPGEIDPIEGSSITSQTFQSKFAFEGGLYIDYEQTVSDRLQLRYGIRRSTFNRLGDGSVNLYQGGNPLRYIAREDIYVQNENIGSESYSKNEVIKNFNGWEPRFSANYVLNEFSALKVGYNRMFQYLHLISNTTSPTPLDVWTPSGEFLDPQSSDQFSMGYSAKIIKKKYDLSVETYYKKMKEVTDFIDGADLLFSEDIETQVIQGNGRAYGLEIQLNKNQGRFTGWMSYTLSRSERKVQGVNSNEYYPTNSDQLHELNLVGVFEYNDRWDLSANWIFGSGRPVTYPSGRYIQNGLVVADYSNRNANRLPTYHRLDVSAKLKPKKDSKREGTWVFSIANLYNRQNAASIFFREINTVNDVEVATGKTEAVKLSYFGIVPSVSYEFKF